MKGLIKMKKKWEGIPLHKKIADVNIREKNIEGFQNFETCLKTMKKTPNECIKKQKCVIGMLIRALIKRGAKI
jgi:hypothetical protein